MGTDCEARLQYDNDNYYLLTWDDPPCIEIRNSQQVIAALGSSLAEDDAPWSRNSKSGGERQPTRDIKELIDWLDEEQDGSNRVPSDNYICDECGYVWMRRILTKHEE